MQNAKRGGRSVVTTSIRRCLLGVAVLIAVQLQPGLLQAQDKPAATRTLYQRIGGYDMIASVVDDFLKQLQADPAFARFGQGRGQNSLMRGRQLVVDQICALSGGPCIYIGREMKTAHQGLKITDAEFDAAGKHMAASLTKFKVSEADQKDFGAMIEKLRVDIVEPPTPKPAADAKN
jgi:hemoglobin